MKVRGRNVASLLLISMLGTLVMVNIQPVHANPAIYYLYVNGFTSAIVDWNTFGPQPWLDAVGVTNYIESSTYGQMIGWFTFDDMPPLAPGEVITIVQIEGYTWTQGYDTDLDVELYVRIAGVPPTVWVGSLWGDSTWAWRTPRWVGDLSTIMPQTLTVSGIDNFAVRYLLYSTSDGLSHGSFKIDSLRLKVYTAPFTITFTPPIVNIGNGGAPLIACTITLPSPPYLGSDIVQGTIMLDGTISPQAFPPPVVSGSTLTVWFSEPVVDGHIYNIVLAPPGAPPPPPVWVTLTITFSLTNGALLVGTVNVLAV